MRRRNAHRGGVVYVEICGGNSERLINACAEAGLLLWQVERTESGALRARLLENDLERLQKIAVLCMSETKLIARSGGSRTIRLLERRAGLLAAAAVFALLLAVSGLFIWDFEVVGNRTLSKHEILRTLADCGISEGCFWPATDVETIRSLVLLREEKLAWMTLNVRGSHATVLVLEREEKPPLYDEEKAADLVALRGGEIAEMTVKNGRALVTAGQLVAAGDTLVSGRMESESGGVRSVHAEGTVTAETWREARVYLSPAAQEKTRRSGVHLILGLKCGKTRLNLAPKGRKELDECDRISKEYNLGIKGVFSFPLSLVVEEFRPYEKEGGFRPDADAAEKRILGALSDEIDGEIVSAEFERGEGWLLLRAHCRENIAILQERTDP